MPPTLDDNSLGNTQAEKIEAFSRLVICLEHDYKGEFSRSVISGAEMLKDINNEDVDNFLAEIESSAKHDYKSWTYRPLCHFNFCVPESRSEIKEFITTLRDEETGVKSYLEQTPISKEAMEILKQKDADFERYYAGFSGNDVRLTGHREEGQETQIQPDKKPSVIEKLTSAKETADKTSPEKKNCRKLKNKVQNDSLTASHF